MLAEKSFRKIAHTVPGITELHEFFLPTQGPFSLSLCLARQKPTYEKRSRDKAEEKSSLRFAHQL